MKIFVVLPMLFYFKMAVAQGAGPDELWKRRQPSAQSIESIYDTTLTTTIHGADTTKTIVVSQRPYYGAVQEDFHNLVTAKIYDTVLAWTVAAFSILVTVVVINK